MAARILVIDDDAILGETLRDALTSETRVVLHSKTGAEGLEHVLAKGPGRLVIVRAVGKGFLIIVASEEANLAMLLIRVRDAAEALSRMLR